MVGISSAGSPSEITLGQGECIQCMTGAEIPAGADTVVMVEDTSGFSYKETVQIFLRHFMTSILFHQEFDPNGSYHWIGTNAKH